MKLQRIWTRRVAPRLGAAAAQARALLGRPPVVHLYSIFWNEAELLPFFFRHYDALVDRYFLYDNGSTDASPALVRAHPRATLGSFEVKGYSFRLEARDFLSQCWKQSRGKADWVILVDIDEHLHHPAGKGYLAACQRAGVTLIPAIGYEMVSAEFPAADSRLADSAPLGARSNAYSKSCVFQPGAIREINFRAGRHRIRPRGHVVRPPKTELKLLHYKHLGEEYLVRRMAELRDRVTPQEQAQKLGVHYFKEAEELRRRQRWLLQAAVPALSDPLPAE